ncbi:MAG: ABC transporter permease, partial [Rhodothermaceae bacterium]|nr:ABC transporter permease [Rhodothermaceae bacterium]
ILSIDTENEARLWIKSSRGWVVQLQSALNGIRRDIRIEQLELDRTLLGDLEKDLNIETLIVDEASRSSTADKLVAAYAIFLVLLAVFMGFAHQFTGITGEKQHRITEQVVSAIEPQAWMDGKILGITGVGIVNVMVYAVIGLIGYAGFMMVFGNIGFMGAITLVNPITMLLFFLIALLGILMWNAFLAAIAATIDNPNTSERSGLMMLPLLPVMFAFFTLYNPDSISMRILSWFPITSPAVLPARMVQTNVMWWEVVVAIVLLVAAIGLFRYLAGKIFATGMLMYGKEPSLREMLYWIRRA